MFLFLAAYDAKLDTYVVFDLDLCYLNRSSSSSMIDPILGARFLGLFLKMLLIFLEPNLE